MQQDDYSLVDLLPALRATDVNTRAVALEALAQRLAVVAGVQLTKWLVDAQQSAGSEIEAVGDNRSAGLSRWGISCWNVSVVTIEELATAVGRCTPYHCSVIVAVTTGHFDPTAVEYANHLVESTNLQVALIEGDALRMIADGSVNPKEAFYRFSVRPQPSRIRIRLVA